MNLRDLTLALVLVGCTATPCGTLDALAAPVDASTHDTSDTSFAAFTLTPPTLDLGDACGRVRAGIRLANTGTLPLGPFAIALSGPDAALLRITDSTCIGALPVHESCFVDVELNAASSVDVVASLDITLADRTTSASIVAGQVSDCPGLGLVTPSPYSFGTVASGQRVAHVFTARSADPRESAPVAVSIGGLGASAFVVVADGCSGATLTPDVACSVVVAFAPSAPGDFTAELVISTPSGLIGPQAVLSGRGL